MTVRGGRDEGDGPSQPPGLRGSSAIIRGHRRLRRGLGTARISPVNPVLLIAESDDTLIEVFRLYCSRSGYDVETAAGGLECLRKLRRSSCQLLVLDVDLPWGGGDGVLALMREDPRLARIPVILISTRVHADLIAPPVVQALRKPFSLNVLVESVRSAVLKDPQAPMNDSHESSPPGFPC